jgi:hypothetical protein
MRSGPSGLGGAGEGDGRRAVTGVLVSEVLAELSGGSGRVEGTKSKRGEAKLSRESRQVVRLKSSSGAGKLVRAAVVEAGSMRLMKWLASAWSQAR